MQYVSWSPDDTHLLTCGSDSDPTLRLWDMGGACQLVIDRHTAACHVVQCLRAFDDVQGVTACAWLPDAARFVSGSTDKVSLRHPCFML